MHFTSRHSKCKVEFAYSSTMCKVHLTLSILIDRGIMIIQRLFWKNLIETAWQHRNVIWLMGLRRVGKTSLCRSLQGIEIFDCELPQVNCV